ncbi:MAG: trigger factor [bacterium]|nr:MAG: trigger factor [bacterium]
MKINVEKTSEVERKLNVEIPWETVREEIDRSLTKIRRTATLKGFRKGKAPLDLVRRIYSDDARQEAINALVMRATRQALDQHNLEPYGNPYLTDVRSEDNEPMVFEAMVELSPRFEVSDYRGLVLERPFREVTSGDVDGFLFTLRERNAEAVPVEDARALRDGDVATVHFKGSKGGEVLQGMDIDDFEIRLGREQLIPGFEEQIVGMKAGEKREFDLPFPEEYPQENLAGETVHFEVLLKEVKEMKIPDLNDDFARTIGEFETLEDLRKNIQDDMDEAANTEAEKALRANLTRSLLDSNVFEVPPSLVDKEIRYLTQEYGENLLRGGLSNEKVRELIMANEADIKRAAGEHVRLMYLVNRIAEKEEIKAEQKEILSVVAQAAQQMGRPVNELMDQYSEDGTVNEIAFNIIRNKVFDTILESATVSDVRLKEGDTGKTENRSQAKTRTKTKPKKKADADAESR